VIAFAGMKHLEADAMKSTRPTGSGDLAGSRKGLVFRKTP
jgi:hypothetical protein